MPDNDSKEKSSNSKWPTGLTFIMYCGGLSLLVLTIYVVVSGKDFSLNAKDATLSTMKTGLAPQGVSTDAAEHKSTELKDQFEKAKSEVLTAAPASDPGQGAGSAEAIAQPFNGSWEGNGSTYVLEQSGQKVLLAEMTNGIVTAYGEGIANGNTATLNVQTALLPISITLTFENATRIKVEGAATFYLTRQ